MLNADLTDVSRLPYINVMAKLSDKNIKQFRSKYSFVLFSLVCLVNHVHRS